MIRYAHWLLPFVLPFVLLGIVRALWWVAGAEWSDPGIMASMCLGVGLLSGVFVASAIEDNRE